MSKKQDAFEIYKTYLGISRHFKEGSGYDYVLYQGRVRASADAFEKRRDIYKFIAVANLIRPNEAEGFFVANTLRLMECPWIGKLTDSKSSECYEQWRGRQTNLEYHFRRDLQTMTRLHGADPLKWFELDGDHIHPPAVREAMAGAITSETYCTLVKIFDIGPILDKRVPDFVIYPKWAFVHYKYSVFVKLPLNVAARILREAIA